ncbi:MAG: hypothetical protein FD133_1641 [Erysipelotrichaceae bacterium]|nr:MAG: hypothetical protein FD179_669 [Erysipelotrichaceae bacterium]TXT16864.1 MAG: hypothetical protein FD133_1641 [Erysipelotrichaceae bacterium]
MEPLSRVKKNAELRQEVENSRESELTSSVLSSYATRLNRINPEISSIESNSSVLDRNPLHSRGEPLRSSQNDESQIDPAFHHDLLNEFIDEVKSYNIKKGYSSSENTEQFVFQKTVQPSSAPQEVNDDQMTQEIKKVIGSQYEQEFLNSDSELKSFKDGELFEETSKIKLKLDDVDKELLEMSQSVNHSSRTLNFIVFMLVVVLIVMLGVAFYWIYSTQGF